MSKTKSVYARRTAGRDRDHRRIGRTIAAGGSSCAGFGPSSFCKNNLRQIGLAFLEYCDLHKGEFPQFVDDKTLIAHSWISTVRRTGAVDAIRTCPEDPVRASGD